MARFWHLGEPGEAEGWCGWLGLLELQARMILDSEVTHNAIACSGLEQRAQIKLFASSWYDQTIRSSM